MAIAYDSSSLGPNPPATAPQTWSHTCSGSDRLLVVGAVSLNDTVTGVTYNGTSMTFIAKTSYPGAGRQGVAMYYLLNPATGTNTISVNGSGNVTGFASSYTGVNQSSQPDSSAVTNPANASSITMTTTVVATGCWLVAVQADAAGGETAGSGTTIRQTHPFGLTISDSNGTVGTGSQSLIINWSGTQPNAGVIASFYPVATSGPTNLKSLNTNPKANIKSYNTNVIANVKSINTNA